MGPRQILVVDDELYITTVLRQKFAQAGHDVRVANDGEEGFAAAVERVPDLIVSDLQMPLLSGVEMAQRLRRTPATAGVPVLMLTARGHRLAPEDLVETNIRAVVDKPFSIRGLMTAIEGLLGGQGLAVPAVGG